VKAAVGFAMGLVFGLGLAMAGMTSPDRVLGFLDVAGVWDPALAFVMGGAVLTATPLFWLARFRKAPVVGGAFDQPPTKIIDRRLIGGAILFGIGWGLAGVCPGPAFVALAIAPVQALPFFAAMLAGLCASALWRMRSA